ncbi:MAG TPA: hypothetical protein VIM85_12305 [Pseudomonadales bacterium]
MLQPERVKVSRLNFLRIIVSIFSIVCVHSTALAAVPVHCHPVAASDLEFYSHKLQTFFNDIHFSPVFNENKITAYKVTSVQKNSRIENYGFEPGDSIEKINNTPISNSEKLISTLSKIRQLPSIELLIQKNHGQKIRYQYLFDPNISCSET